MKLRRNIVWKSNNKREILSLMCMSTLVYYFRELTPRYMFRFVLTKLASSFLSFLNLRWSDSLEIQIQMLPHVLALLSLKSFSDPLSLSGCVVNHLILYPLETSLDLASSLSFTASLLVADSWVRCLADSVKYWSCFLCFRALSFFLHLGLLHYSKSLSGHICYLEAVGLHPPQSQIRKPPWIIYFFHVSAGVLWIKVLEMDLANWSGERKIRGRLWVAPWTHQSLENQGWKWVGTLTCGPRVRNVVNDPRAGAIWSAKHWWEEWTPATPCTRVSLTQDANRERLWWAQCSHTSAASVDYLTGRPGTWIYHSPKITHNKRQITP